MADILIVDEGSIVGFCAETPAGKTWLTDNLVAESWQWMGDTLWCGHREADVIIAAAAEAGLQVV